MEALGQALGVRLPVKYLLPGSPVLPLPTEISGFLSAMETFESFIDMSQTAPTC